MNANLFVSYVVALPNASSTISTGYGWRVFDIEDWKVACPEDVETLSDMVQKEAKEVHGAEAEISLLSWRRLEE